MTQNFLAEHYTLPRQVEPLTNRFLWASGPAAAAVPVGERVNDRYQVIAPQIWFDLDPDHPPQLPDLVPDALQPYLYLFAQHRHIPTLYGLEPLENGELAILLERVPLDREGHLWPSLVTALPQASADLQIHWLEQILKLWQPLLDQGVTASLLKLMNIRVRAGDLRLIELLNDQEEPLGTDDEVATTPGTLLLLGQVLKSLMPLLQPEVAAAIAPLLPVLQQEGDLLKARALLLQTWQDYRAHPQLQLEAIALTDPGWRGGENEDSAYPLPEDLGQTPQPQWIAVCDGLGGHVGGEVASQTAIAGLKVQIPQLLAHRQSASSPADSLNSQLQTSIRIVNDLIAQRNPPDSEALARMGTTLVLALKAPGDRPELTIAHIGDSRAYWLTPHGCERLTLDHDVATQTVCQGYRAYRAALRLAQGASLSQAMGVMASSRLHVSIQQFRVLEPGILLLCSDGLSDYGLVETFGHVDVGAVFDGSMSLTEWGQHWIHRARQLTGHDNISIAAFWCQLTAPISQPKPDLTPVPQAVTTIAAAPPASVEPEVSAIALSWQAWLGAILVAILLGAGIGWIVPSPPPPIPRPESVAPPTTP